MRFEALAPQAPAELRLAHPAVAEDDDFDVPQRLGADSEISEMGAEAGQAIVTRALR
jgi:hypothetical protein